MNNTDNLNSLTVCERHRNATPVHHATGRKDAGQALLELALVMPFLLLLLIGGLEFGKIAFGSIEVANAAAAGALYGAQNHATASDTAGIRQAAQNDAANLNLARPILTVTPTTSCACQTGTIPTVISCASTTGCVTPSRVIQWVSVDTTATVDPLFHYPGFPNTVTLQGHATMRVQQ